MNLSENGKKSDENRPRKRGLFMIRRLLNLSSYWETSSRAARAPS